MPKLVYRRGADVREYRLDEAVTIGRQPGNTIQILEPQASRNHLRIAVTGPDCLLEDLGSSNGTFINGRRVTRYLLQHGDIIRIGDTQFVFEMDAPKPAPAVPAAAAAQQDAVARTMAHPSSAWGTFCPTCLAPNSLQAAFCQTCGSPMRQRPHRAPRPPPGALRPPSGQGRPPSGQIRPPSGQGRPPSGQIRPPSGQIAPPSPPVFPPPRLPPGPSSPPAPRS